MLYLAGVTLPAGTHSSSYYCTDNWATAASSSVPPAFRMRVAMRDEGSVRRYNVASLGILRCDAQMAREPRGVAGAALGKVW